MIQAANWFRLEMKNAPPQEDLYSDDINKIMRAGGLEERDYADYSKKTVFKYHSYGTLKSTELFYSDIEDIRCFCHGALCAVLLNQSILEIINLDQRLVFASYSVPNACLVYWNPQGTEVLVVYERNKVQRFSYKNNSTKPLAKPYLTMKEHEKAYRARGGRREVLEIFQLSCPVHRNDTPAYTGSILGSRRPIFAAFSIKGNRLACYYYYLNHGTIRLFRLNDRELLAESMVDPIFWNDSVGRPIYFNEDGSALILISRGKRHLWKMDSLKWVHNVKMGTDDQTEFVHDLQKKYFNCVKSWLPDGNSGTAHPEKGIWNIMQKAIMLLLAPLICSRQINRDENVLLRQRMQHVPIVEGSGLWWVIDCYHSMIHVCDESGNWICHEQLQEEIFDFNVIERTVYVLPRDLSDPIQLDIVSI